ncbi:MAG: hypothetical protein ABEI78_00840, partial [Candidatus Nanohaloarchaea archaeon]
MTDEKMDEISGSLIVKEEKILLVLDKELGYWRIPRKEVTDDEPPSEAASKAGDEINVSIQISKPFYTGEFLENDELTLWHTYKGEIDGKPEVDSNNDLEKVQWFET